MNRTNSGTDHIHPVYAILFVLVSGLALLLVLYLRFCHRRESEYVKKGDRLGMYRDGTKRNNNEEG